MSNKSGKKYYMKSSSTGKPLSFIERTGYASGDFACSMYWVVFGQFLMFFYTDVAGLPIAAVSTLLLVTRFWDTINDPIMGLVADRTQTRHGKYRPWLIWMIGPMIISGILVFTIPDGSENFKLVYAFVTYSVVGMVYTAINLPYAALMGVMSPSPSERTTLATFRYIGSFTGNFVPQLSILALVAFIGGGNKQFGYVGAMTIYGVMAGLLFYFAFKATRERVQPVKEKRKSSVRSDMGYLFRNKPWLIIAVAGTLSLVAISIKNAIAIYYFTYYIGDQGLVSSFLAVGTASAMVGIVLTKNIIRFFGDKRRSYIFVNLFISIGYAVFYFAGTESIALIFSMQVFAMFFSGLMMPLMFSMYADTADYGEWYFQRRTTGLIFASGTSALKLGMTFGGAFCGWILAFFGYIPNVEQSAESLSSIVDLMSWIPALFALAATGVLILYPLDATKEQIITKELSERRLNS